MCYNENTKGASAISGSPQKLIVKETTVSGKDGGCFFFMLRNYFLSL
jgi:hypothetical protein